MVKLEGNWRDVKNACRTTVGKRHTEKDATERFKRDLVIAEHTSHHAPFLFFTLGFARIIWLFCIRRNCPGTPESFCPRNTPERTVLVDPSF